MRPTWASWRLRAQPERRALGPACGPLPGRLHLSPSLSASLCPPTVSVSLFSLFSSPSFSLWVLLVSLYDFPYLSCPCFPIAPVCLSERVFVFPSLVSSGPPGSLCICPPHLKAGTPVTPFAAGLLSVVSWPGTCLLALWRKGSSWHISAPFPQGHSTCCSPCPHPSPCGPAPSPFDVFHPFPPPALILHPPFSSSQVFGDKRKEKSHPYEEFYLRE